MLFEVQIWHSRASRFFYDNQCYRMLHAACKIVPETRYVETAQVDREHRKRLHMSSFLLLHWIGFLVHIK